ncbi:YwdI family protein [Halobacillus litoralis]|uniref:YwdI family protein n=1 Tax=Halobacillus litoralis TaxID=45668 RepID=UPI001CD280E1|nr:YwdI family protein [Halobacillus litoralis]MCA0971084.1 YwdI family protein [Halobacillus litoralis]
MAISNQTVLKKMSNEIQEAMLQHGNDEKVKEHVRSVRLLADLFLEQETSSKRSVIEPTSDEVRAMMGGGTSKSTEQKGEADEPTPEEIRVMMGGDKPQSSKKTKGDDEANGESIFDF